MDNTVIIFSSKHGICEKVAKHLSNNLNCAYQNVLYTNNIDKYDNIILGTSVYMGSANKYMHNFLRTNYNELLKKNLALFTTCMIEENKETQVENAFKKDLLDKSFFSGCIATGINMEKLNFMEKLIVSKVSNNQSSFYKLDQDRIEDLNYKVSRL